MSTKKPGNVFERQTGIVFAIFAAQNAVQRSCKSPLTNAPFDMTKLPLSMTKSKLSFGKSNLRTSATWTTTRSHCECPSVEGGITGHLLGEAFATELDDDRRDVDVDDGATVAHGVTQFFGQPYKHE